MALKQQGCHILPYQTFRIRIGVGIKLASYDYIHGHHSRPETGTPKTTPIECDLIYIQSLRCSRLSARVFMAFFFIARINGRCKALTLSTF